MHPSEDGMDNKRDQEVVSKDCVMVRDDWSQEHCARICLVDEDKKIIFRLIFYLRLMWTIIGIFLK